jgi:hypothetical protein
MLRRSSIVATHAQEKRSRERVCTALPVRLDTATGVTRDVSASGIFFETDSPDAVGGLISLTVELDTPRGKRVLRCQGDVVRIEPSNTRVGVAVKIIESTMVLV